jgi:hypothetical protein
MGVLRRVDPRRATILVHGRHAGRPRSRGADGFALLSLLYFRRFACTTPLQTAVVAPVFEKSYAMFASPLGTWIPFALIFAATYVTGSAVTRKWSR